MKIKSNTGGRTVSVVPRGNGGLSIVQGPHHILLTAAEWRELVEAADFLLQVEEVK